MTAMPVAEPRRPPRNSWQRPYDPRERGAELIRGAWWRRRSARSLPARARLHRTSSTRSCRLVARRASGQRARDRLPIDVLIGPRDVYGPGHPLVSRVTAAHHAGGSPARTPFPRSRDRGPFAEHLSAL